MKLNFNFNIRLGCYGQLCGSVKKLKMTAEWLESSVIR
jgi:hypothetical protein